MQQLVPGRARANQPHVQTHSAAPGGNVTFHDNRPLRFSNDGSAQGADACHGPSSERPGQVRLTPSLTGCLRFVFK